MRLYESTFILSPQADEAAFDRQIKAVSDVIHRYEGKIIRESRWGIRRLAYPIKRFTQGYYTRLVFEGNEKVLSELERFYKIEEPYIRYLTVVFEGDLEEEQARSLEEHRPEATERPALTPAPAAPIPEKAIPVKEVPAVEEKNLSGKNENDDEI
jgi:small subunit ribosomal protein S6